VSNDSEMRAQGNSERFPQGSSVMLSAGVGAPVRVDVNERPDNDFIRDGGRAAPCSAFFAKETR
jgi:hypothetical protein